MCGPEPARGARARLAEQQLALVQALTGRGEAPEGFSAEEVRRAARSLASKRRRQAARAWPALVACLGERFRERFAAFAARTPLPAEGGPLADGRAFRDSLEARERTDEVRLAVLAVDLRFRRGRGGLVPRRGLAAKAAWLRQARRVVVGVRLPGLGVFGLTLPVGWRRA